MRNLSIGLVAPPWVAVPPPQYGGTELVVDHLARGFAAAGHAVRLFTTGDASCPVDRSWVHPTAVGTTGGMLDELVHVQAAYGHLHGCDVIHDHTLLGPVWAAAAGIDVPIVTTVHGEFTAELTRLYEIAAQHATVVAISHHQRSTAPSVPVGCVIHHGIDVDRFPLGRGEGGYVLFLGRMHPSKGVHRAIEVARLAGKKLLIAAKMWEDAEYRYFKERVEPLLGADAEHIGQVGGREKLEVLGAAEALVNPIRWPEPFGLVMIEALACGTPVLAFPEGAAPEIVTHRETGFLCQDEADMADRLLEAGSLDRQACRDRAMSYFSTEQMVGQHLALYQDLVRSARGRITPIGPLPTIATSPSSTTSSPVATVPMPVIGSKAMIRH